MSETTTCRHALKFYCMTPNGLDIGHGGDLIVPWAIGLDRPDGDGRRANYGISPTHLTHDAANLPFKDDTLDWVYSSHVLEDFDDTYSVLKEWMRVLKPSGNLVLFLPDQARYEEHCRANGSLPNQEHKHKDFSADWIYRCVNKASFLDEGTWEISHVKDPVDYNPYSFEMVITKLC